MLIRGDARFLPLGSNTMDCVITSPPYYGLRNYGTPGQMGLEESPQAYVDTLVDVFREVWRVLKDNGTVWLNLGDSYAPNWSSVRPTGGGGFKDDQARARWTTIDLAPKNLIGIPWRVAFALQADGWYLRSDIIWAKPNPMPESVTDRPTKSHEYLFLLAKSGRYYYDAEAIREANSEDMILRAANGHTRGAHGKLDASRQDADTLRGPRAMLIEANGRNKRSVWTVATESYRGAHFATFPEALIEPCVLAGTSAEGQCARCGAPRVRVVERETYREVSGERAMAKTPLPVVRAGWRDPERQPKVVTVGWSASCVCEAASVPSVVLDPFCGTGTVGAVAERCGRQWVGVDLAYQGLARERTAQRGLLFV